MFGVWGLNQLSINWLFFGQLRNLRTEETKRRQYVLKHRARRCVSGIRNGLANGRNDLSHGLPNPGLLRLPGKLLLDGDLDLGANQARADSKESGRLSLAV